MSRWLLTKPGDNLVGEDAHAAQSKRKSHQSLLHLLPVSLAIRDPPLSLLSSFSSAWSSLDHAVDLAVACH